jgi:hypothetical protein
VRWTGTAKISVGETTAIGNSTGVSVESMILLLREAPLWQAVLLLPAENVVILAVALSFGE